MIVKLDLDPKLVWRLEEQAEAEGVTVAQIVARAFAPRSTVQGSAGDRTRAEVARLHGAGLPDAEIAVRVGRVQEHVARVRRGLGLKPNRRRQRVGV